MVKLKADCNVKVADFPSPVPSPLYHSQLSPLSHPRGKHINKFRILFTLFVVAFDLIKKPEMVGTCSMYDTEEKHGGTLAGEHEGKGTCDKPRVDGRILNLC